jgi:aryl-alcohol dehydrogenase-like predicted oxidoreductase
MVNHDVNNPEDLEIIKRAFDLGINFFDTAEIYHNGLAE